MEPVSTNTATLELAERLRARRSEIAERLARVQADRRRASGPLEDDFAEQAVERENDEVLDALDAVERREIADIDRALARIEAECFGICDECGRDIDPARLEVQPAATSCIACASSREQRGR